MLSLTVVLEIRRLLDETDLSQRAIAQRMRVSRGTVMAMANGRRGLHGRHAGDNPDDEVGRPVRCRGCGGLVYPPCRLCQVRQYLRRQQLFDAAATGRPFSWQGPKARERVA